jgi:hypothetical protein
MSTFGGGKIVRLVLRNSERVVAGITTVGSEADKEVVQQQA